MDRPAVIGYAVTLAGFLAMSPQLVTMNVFSKRGGVSRALGAILGGVAVAGFLSCSSQPIKPAGAMRAKAALRRQTLLDAEWLFYAGDGFLATRSSRPATMTGSGGVFICPTTGWECW